EQARTLVRGNDSVRRALGERYLHILVDEFQDTDPVQAEILFLIAATELTPRWQECILRPGSLFLVGDPKQAGYGFRGAAIESYKDARLAIERHWPENVLQVTANFRSRPGVLAQVNRCFAQPLSDAGQPGYVALSPTLPDPEHHLPCVARITVGADLGASANA